LHTAQCSLRKRKKSDCNFKKKILCNAQYKNLFFEHLRKKYKTKRVYNERDSLLTQTFWIQFKNLHNWNYTFIILFKNQTNKREVLLFFLFFSLVIYLCSTKVEFEMQQQTCFVLFCFFYYTLLTKQVRKRI